MVAVVREKSAEISARFAVIGLTGVIAYVLAQVAFWALDWVRDYR